MDAALASFSADTRQEVTRGYRHGAWAVLGAFFASLISVGLSFWWLAMNGPTSLYGVVIIVFALQLAIVAGVAAFVTYGVAAR